jgi:hypothetical protein
MAEVWRSVAGYEGLYEVSDLGRVLSLSRTVRHGWSQWQMVPQRLLKPILNGGYYKVNLYDEGGSVKIWGIHRLVAFAFLGPCPSALIVRHGPKGSLCNEVENLSYGTYAENTADRLRDGTACRGSKSPCSKLTETQVLEIFNAKLTKDFKRRQLAELYSVSEATIKSIRAGNNWKHLTSIHENASRR